MNSKPSDKGAILSIFQLYNDLRSRSVTTVVIKRKKNNFKNNAALLKEQNKKTICSELVASSLALDLQCSSTTRKKFQVLIGAF